jgi:hypothetical protein
MYVRALPARPDDSRRSISPEPAWCTVSSELGLGPELGRLIETSRTSVDLQ